MGLYDLSVYNNLSFVQTDGRIRDADAHVTVSKTFIAGGCAGIISKSCLAPLDRIKIIFQVSEKKFTFRNGYKLGRQIYMRDGFWSLFRGNSATVLR